MHEQILNFWFHELEPKMWWKKDPQLDELIRERFSALHRQAQQSELFAWRHSPRGSLAEIILLDQFSRNMFRDQPQAFACDPLALALAQTAIDKGFDLLLNPDERSFLYMPFMHSESRLIHEQALKLFTALGNPSNLEFEIKHKVIIDRFDRYPHRNEVLGRTSTAEEIEFLKQPNSRF